MPSKKHSFNVILDVVDVTHLKELAQKTRQSQGALVRQLLDAAYMHLILEQPTCADGRRCHVPQMHARPPSPTPLPPAP